MQSALLGGGEVHGAPHIHHVDALDGWIDMHDDGQNLAARDR